MNKTNSFQRKMLKGCIALSIVLTAIYLTKMLYGMYNFYTLDPDKDILEYGQKIYFFDIKNAYVQIILLLCTITVMSVFLIKWNSYLFKGFIFFLYPASLHLALVIYKALNFYMTFHNFQKFFLVSFWNPLTLLVLAILILVLLFYKGFAKKNFEFDLKTNLWGLSGVVTYLILLYFFYNQLLPFS